MAEDNELDQAIRSWHGYQDVLRYDDRKLYAKMLAETKAYESSFNILASKDADQALFLTLILRQQVMITKLFEEIAKCTPTHKGKK